MVTVSDVSLSYSCKHDDLHDDLRVQPAFSSILEDYEFQYNHVFKLNSSCLNFYPTFFLELI